jgi:hypothetical protein
MSNDETAPEAAAQLPAAGPAPAAPEWIREGLVRADKEVRSLLTQHPILSLACAVGAGYLIARLLRSRS